MLKKISGLWGFRFFLNNKNMASLLGKSVLLLVIPYAYLMLCGLIFDYLLKWYFMTTFIFFSLIFLYLVAIWMIVMAFMNYFKHK